MRPSSRFTCAVLALSLAAQAEDWSMYLHDLRHSSFNAAESTVGVRNAASLNPAWKLSLGKPIASAPTLVNGTLYFGAWDGNFYAVQASTGAVLWKQFVGKSAGPPDPWCQAATGVSSQPVVLGSSVYVGGGDAALYGLDASSGSIQWRTAMADPLSRTYLWSSIMPLGGSLYYGLASLDDCPLVQGAIARLDVNAPARPQVKYLSPADQPGSGIWSTPALDTASNTAYATTGTGLQDPATGSWGSSFLAFDASTLAIKSYYLLPSYNPDLDIEWGSSALLFETANAARYVAATGKDGVLYVLNRDNMTLAWTVRLAVSCVCPECGCGSLSTPASDGRYLYVGAGVADADSFDHGSVYAIDPETHQVKWMRGLDGTVIAPVTVANGVVWVPSTTGALAFTAESGEQLWRDNTGITVYSQIVVANGIVYITYFNGDVIAWKPGKLAGHRPKGLGR